MENFDVNQLDDEALLKLRDQVNSATEDRRRKAATTIKLQDIKVGMKPEDRKRALAEISRALRQD